MTMNLYEVTNGWMGESYVRAYAWAGSEERALELAAGAFIKGVSTLEATFLFSADSPEFVTKPSDSGFEQ